MDIISIAVILIILGFLLWLANSYIPMAPPIKKILNIAVVVLVIIWLLGETGILQHLHQHLNNVHYW